MTACICEKISNKNEQKITQDELILQRDKTLCRPCLENRNTGKLCAHLFYC